MSLRRNLIYLPAFLMDMSTNSAILGIPFYASKLGASPLVIGVMASVNTLLYVVFSRVFGKLSDRVSRKRVPQIACICFSLLYFLIPLSRDLRQLFILFPFTGLTLSAFWPALEAWVGEQSDGRPLAKRVMMFNLSWTAGVMVGYTTGGYIYELHPFAPFYFASISALFSASAITLQPKHYHLEDKTPRPSGLADPQEDTRPAMKYLYMSWAANFFSWLTLGIMRYIFPKLIHELGMAPRIFGLLMLGWSSVQALMFFILGTTKRWHYRDKLLIGFQMLGCLSFLTIWLADSTYAWAFALMLFGVHTGMTYFSSIYYSLCGHADLGNKSGWHESILSSGGFFGPFIGGALANYVGLKSPYLFCAMAIIVGLALQISILRIKSAR